jgi:hypothetical protein
MRKLEGAETSGESLRMNTEIRHSYRDGQDQQDRKDDSTFQEAPDSTEGPAFQNAGAVGNSIY